MQDPCDLGRGKKVRSEGSDGLLKSHKDKRRNKKYEFFIMVFGRHLSTIKMPDIKKST